MRACRGAWQRAMEVPAMSGCQETVRDLPSGYVKIAIENDPVEMVDFPSYKMVDLSIVMLVYQRV